MRSKLIMLAIVIVSMTLPQVVRAQDSESRVEAITAALGEIRRGLPGKANLNVPPQPGAPTGFSRNDAIGAAKRLQLTINENANGFAGHPADVQLAVRGAAIGADAAKILLMRAVKKPDGKYEGTAETIAVDLERVSGRWQVKKSYVHSVH